VTLEFMSRAGQRPAARRAHFENRHSVVRRVARPARGIDARRSRVLDAHLFAQPRDFRLLAGDGRNGRSDPPASVQDGALGERDCVRQGTPHAPDPSSR
jgi:hypothetical protein